MKVHMFLRWVKILAWLILIAVMVKIFSLEKLTAENAHSHGLPAKMVSADPASRKTVHASHRHKYELANEPLKLKQLLDANAQKNWSRDGNCAPYPRHKDLHIVNVHYQFTVGGNVTYYMFGAYYDRRHAVENAPSIAILAMFSSIPGPFEPAYCQVWYEDNDTPDIVEMQHQQVAWYEVWGNGPDLVYPVLLNCPLQGSPRSYRVPQLVSLVFTDRCARATNALRVVYEAPQRSRATRFAVCVKDLQFPGRDMSERWMEWLELMRLLGAERVTAYDLGGATLTANTRRTLQHYAQHDGFLQLRPHTLLQGHPVPTINVEASKRLNEVLIYIDCFYRNMYEFDYVAIFDVDEVIMPLGELHNWPQLVQHLERNSTLAAPDSACKAYASYCFRNVYYPQNLTVDESPPRNFYMLRHVRRVAEHLDANSAVKCLHSTHFVTSVHNHFPMSWRLACAPLDVPTSVGQMQHYREPDDKMTLEQPTPVRDDNIWRFRDQLISNVLAKRRELGR
ncbi:hypothetical protein ACLKA7_006645 [Drosophila subpalustris]